MTSAGEMPLPDGSIPTANGWVAAKPPKRGRNYFAADHRDILDYPKFKPLGYRRETRALQAAQAGDSEALHLVWSANVRLAFAGVNRFRIPPGLLADCVQEGILGLHRAIQKYESERLLVFSTYAWNWVTQHIQRHLVRNRFGHRGPDYLYADYCRFRRALQDCRTGADWYDHRSRWLDQDPSRYATLCRFHAIVEAAPLARDHHPSAPGPGPLDILEQLDLVAAVHRALDLLDPAYRDILILRYGLLGNPEKTLEEVGARHGVTRERIRQLQKKAEANLRLLLSEHYPSLATPLPDIADNLPASNTPGDDLPVNDPPADDPATPEPLSDATERPQTR